ncbi:MAG: hypothetical protein QJR02_09060 [Sinobacteraceae bacterium]|nr:hypothetical protein [Nevskiaceae bacterium]
MTREKLKTARRWVVKIGSSLVTARGQGLDRAAIADWCGQIAALRAEHRQLVLVSSGAVAEGMARIPVRTPALARQAERVLPLSEEAV